MELFSPQAWTILLLHLVGSQGVLFLKDNFGEYKIFEGMDSALGHENGLEAFGSIKSFELA